VSLLAVRRVLNAQRSQDADPEHYEPKQTAGANVRRWDRESTAESLALLCPVTQLVYRSWLKDSTLLGLPATRTMSFSWMTVSRVV
jgi:hypothetical protein